MYTTLSGLLCGFKMVQAQVVWLGQKKIILYIETIHGLKFIHHISLFSQI